MLRMGACCAWAHAAHGRMLHIGACCAWCMNDGVWCGWWWWMVPVQGGGCRWRPRMVSGVLRPCGASSSPWLQACKAGSRRAMIRTPVPSPCAACPQTGTYTVTPNYETLFCAGHTWTSDGTLVAAGGDMGARPPMARGRGHGGRARHACEACAVSQCPSRRMWVPLQACTHGHVRAHLCSRWRPPRRRHRWQELLPLYARGPRCRAAV